MIKAELTNCIETLRLEIELLAKNYGIVGLAIFGSVARRENGPESDIDILIDFKETPSLFTLIVVEQYLTKLLGFPVDILLSNGLSSTFLRYIREDIVEI